MATTEHLTFERDGATAIVTMNRPEAKNALSLPMLVGMKDAWEEIDGNDDIRCAILTGAGGTFCAGMDLKAMGGSDAEKYQPRMAEDPDLHWKALLRHYDLRKPLIAAVEGWAVAGGTEILQATHIRVAGESAMFGVFEARRGLFPLGGSTVRLRRQIPYTVAMELLLTAREVPADEALRIGLIGHVVPDGTALDKALRDRGGDRVERAAGGGGDPPERARDRGDVRGGRPRPRARDRLARLRQQRRRRGTEGLRREAAAQVHPHVSGGDRPLDPPPGGGFPGVDGPSTTAANGPLNDLAAAVRRIIAVAVGQPLARSTSRRRRPR